MGKGRNRREFIFTDDAAERLDALCDQTDQSRAGVIRNALRTYEFLVKKKIEGFTKMELKELMDVFNKKGIKI